TFNSNAYFNYLFASKIDAEVRYLKAAAFFNYAERMNSVYDSSETHKSFYQSLSNEKFCDAGILNSEHGMQLQKYCLTFNLIQKTGSQLNALKSSFVDKASSLCNDTVRGAFVTQHLGGVTNYEQFKSEIEPFRNSLVTVAMREAYRNKLDELTKYAKG